MDQRKSFNRLDFDEDTVLNHQVNFETAIHTYILKTYRKYHLPLHNQSPVLKFSRQRNLIDRFKEPGSELLMQTKSSIDDVP